MTVNNTNLTSRIFLSGLIGELAFEAYSWFISPIIFGPTLEPAKLVMALGGKLFGLQLSYPIAFIIHFLIGTLLFAFLVYFVRKVTRLPHIGAGLLTGLGLWFTAQGILAPFIGRSFMMDYGPYTQSSFIAHTSMMIIIAYAMKRLKV